MARTMSRELATLYTALAHWRRQGGGGRGKRIPEVLWQQAAAVARVEGVLQTARATRLNYARLKACLTEADSVRAQEPWPPAGSGPAKHSRRSRGDSETLVQSEREPRTAPDAQFVAVQMSSSRRDSMTIELISRSGERMRIESTVALDLAGVVRSFWSTRS